jgi:hypothetical protein
MDDDTTLALILATVCGFLLFLLGSWQTIITVLFFVLFFWALGFA